MVVGIDEQDRVVYQKRLRNEPGEILRALAPYQETLHGIVVESIYNWYWLVDGLMAAGDRMHLANTTAIEQLGQDRQPQLTIRPIRKDGLMGIAP